MEARRGWRDGGQWVPGPGSQDWVLDMLGNWVTKRDDLTGNGYDQADERAHNEANEIVERTVSEYPLPFAYDQAGNLRSAGRSEHATDVYTHDAWNRLVRHEVQDENETVALNAEYEYNGLHWRTAKRVAEDDSYTPARPAEGRVMYYSAAWQLLEEWIDDDGEEGTDAVAQQVWGLRYIDDAVMRRVNRGDMREYYHITDVQFSTVAMTETGLDPQVVERVGYEAYGKARHRWPGDFNRDGFVDDDDLDHWQYGAVITDGDIYEADVDLNRDGQIDEADLELFSELWYGRGPLGEGMISDPQGPGNVIGYDGYLFSAESGLYCPRFRWYSPDLGRWVERDPAGYRDGNNLYLYVRAQPISQLDPFGLQVGYYGNQEAYSPGRDNPEATSQCTTAKCGDVEYDTGTQCCEAGMVVDKQSVFVINRGLPGEAGMVPGSDRLTGGHIDLAIPGIGMLGFYGGGDPNGSGAGCGFNMDGYFLNSPESWLNGIDATHPGRPWYAIGREVIVQTPDGPRTLAGKLSEICELKVCPSQVKGMNDTFNKLQCKPGRFNIVGRNCSSTACEILGGGGVGTGEIPGLDHPGGLMDKMKALGADCFQGYTSVVNGSVTIEKN